MAQTKAEKKKAIEGKKKNLSGTWKSSSFNNGMPIHVEKSNYKKNTYLEYKLTTVNESGERVAQQPHLNYDVSNPTKSHLMSRDGMQYIIEKFKLKRVKEN